jgi:hypothetical protein
VPALTVRENGLNGPPPPVMVTFAVAIGLQPGCGPGLGEGLALGEGLGDGLGVWAGVWVAPRLRKIALRAMTIHWIPNGGSARRVWGD